MIKPFHFVAGALAVALCCSAASAQMRGGASAMRAPSARMAAPARATSEMPRAVRQVRLMQPLPSGGIRPSLGSFATSANSGHSRGSGFNGGFRNGRTPRFGRGARDGASVFVPLLYGGGYPYYNYGDVPDDSSDYGPPPQQPQNFVAPPPPIPQQYPDSGYAPNSGPANDAVVSPPAQAAAPVQDIGEFDLVRKDGRVLFASAFMVAGNQLTYVTPEGMRRTLPMADLDIDATQQMNEARGTTVQIHN